MNGRGGATTPCARTVGLPVAVILAGCTALFARTYDVGLLGWDAYPIIISARIRSFADLVGAFSEKLMNGRYAGDFYRPVLNLSVGIDYAVWGLRPFGYQLTNILLFAGCAVSLFLLARRLLGPGAWVGPLLAAIVFVAHPLQFEVLPVMPRRPELLCCLFMFLSLSRQLAPSVLALRRPPVSPAVFSLLAMASKETAMAFPLLSFLAVLMHSERRGWLSKLIHAGVATIPHAGALALIVLVRWSVLGGLGGHATMGVIPNVDYAPVFLVRIATRILYPQALMRDYGAAKVLPIVLGVGLSAMGVAAHLRRSKDAPDRKCPRAHYVRAGLLGLAWMVVFALTYFAAGRMRSWYYLILVAGWAIVAGALAEGAIYAIRRGVWSLRLCAIPTAAAFAALVVWQWSYSPIVCRYDGWDRGTKASEAFFHRLNERLSNASNGSRIVAPPLPRLARAPRDKPRLRGVPVLTDYSIQAWADLTLPQKTIRVVRADDRMVEPSPDEVVVLLTRRVRYF